MDRRQKKTRKAIYAAFTEILKEESYSKITVQQIIERADIGRTTFYSHFETKDELLNAFCTDIFDHVFSKEPEKERTHDFSQVHDVRSQITHILYHLKEHMDYLPGILSGESEDIFMGYFKKHLEKIFSKVISSYSSPAPKEYLLNHLVCDFAETVRWWTKNQSYSPEEICGFFYETIPV